MTIPDKGLCDDRTCPLNGKCVKPTSDECECKNGFSDERNRNVCEDINECWLDHGCDTNSTCINLDGSYNCVCNSGYVGDGKTCVKGKCTEDLCPQNEQCASPTTLDCECRDGFERNQTSRICVDIDECSMNERVCDENAYCVNTDGSFKCRCRKGFFGNGLSCFKGSCSDSNCGKNRKCKSPTTLDCECKEGFKLNGLSVCVDIDECQKFCKENISRKCENNQGSFTCSCKEGFYRETNKTFLCSDLNECETEAHNCHFNATCTNTAGSYDCFCTKGFKGDGYNCTDINECLYGWHNCPETTTCIDTYGNYSCSCEPGYAWNGKVCSDIDRGAKL